jgi:4-hydroxy-2-oxoheptanedioate aldolase
MFFKQRLRDEEGVLHGVMAVVPSAASAQAMAAAGADFLLVDREHGPIGREAMHAMIAATAGTACAPLVRVPAIDEAEVKVALDAGAEGIVYPLVRSAEEVERCVAYTRYPPDGTRGFGPFTAHSRHGVGLLDYTRGVGPNILCCVLIETAEAVREIDAILAVPGLDIAVIAPFDLSGALGVEGRFDAPEFTQAVATVEAAAGRAGVPLGGVALTQEVSTALAARGYRMLLNGFDTMMLADRTAAFRTWE